MESEGLRSEMKGKGLRVTDGGWRLKLELDGEGLRDGGWLGEGEGLRDTR